MLEELLKVIYMGSVRDLQETNELIPKHFPLSIFKVCDLGLATAKTYI